MAKQDYIFRYLAIIRKLRRSGEATLEEIRDFLAQESEYHDRPFRVSNRTFVRDLNEIREIFSVDIRYDFSRKCYYIAGDPRDDLNERMLESADLINTLKVATDLSHYMFFESRRAHGTHHFHGLLAAIRARMAIRMVHQRFDSDRPRERTVEPYALKESKGRWYLVARDREDRRTKTFGLDRILSFESTPARFDYPPQLDVAGMFRHCFGVINPDEGEPDDIILSFEPAQGKYIESYPIHDTQETLVRNAKEFRIRLKLFPTRDLVMEILSYGDGVKVLQPAKLAKEVAGALRRAAERYGRK